MRAKKAKSLRRMCSAIANPNTKGLLHPGLAEIVEKMVKGKKKVLLRSIRRTWGMDSPRKLYLRLKRLTVRHQLPEYFHRLRKRMDAVRAQRFAQ